MSNHIKYYIILVLTFFCFSSWSKPKNIDQDSLSLKSFKDTKYPSVLVTVGMNDSRVPPWHSFKFATRLNKSTVSKSPILLKVNFDSGHAIKFSKKDEEFNMNADVYSIALWQTGYADYQFKE